MHENDYVNWLIIHTAKEKNHFKNLKLRQETALKAYINSIKLREDNPIKRFKEPLVKVLEFNLRDYTLQELNNNPYNTMVDDGYYVRAA
jgi:hypothetical protein